MGDAEAPEPGCEARLRRHPGAWLDPGYRAGGYPERRGFLRRGVRYDRAVRLWRGAGLGEHRQPNGGVRTGRGECWRDYMSPGETRTSRVERPTISDDG